MTATTDILPLERTVTPNDVNEVAASVREAASTATPIYPLGGGTSLNFGLPPRAAGIGLSLGGLNRVVDYPARDMTISVEAGITMAELATTLAAERQRLPIDVPRSADATLGGVLATNWSGPRRYGCGTIRDYTIGIEAVDGHATRFHGGGRVVKNVAGYDFCKLLVGSLGTLAVITQVTLKVLPIPEASALVACDVDDLETANRLLAALVDSRTMPTAIELVSGPAWADDAALGPAKSGCAARLIVGLEGTAAEVVWMVDQLRDEWQHAGAAELRRIDEPQLDGLWQRLIDFPTVEAPLVLKASVVPGAATSLIRRLLEVDPQCSVTARAGSGIVLARFAEFAAENVSRKLIGVLQPAAQRAGGHVVVLSAAEGLGLTRQAVWGGTSAETAVMRAVKQKFDPQGLLNPGRYLYD